MLRSTARAAAATLAAVLCAGLSVAAATAPAASAAPRTGETGSLVYIKNKNIWLSTPDATSTRQLTTNGGTPTSDGTGDTGFHVPSESDTGVILAYRNQEEHKGQPSEYTQGYIWEYNRYGHLIRKFKPAQFKYISGGSCNPAVLELLLGLLNAVISPDGKYIAYTAQTYVQTAGCDTVQGYSSWIANADGSNAHQVTRGSGDSGASLEIGQFTADSSKLLVDDADFGSVEDFYVNIPGSTAHDWTAQTDLLDPDAAYAQPDVRGSFLTTVGYSSLVSRNALRLWHFNGFSNDPGGYCDYQSPVADAGFSDLEWLSRPSLAPDGSVVVWEDSSSDGSVAKSGQGIYTLPTSTLANNCNTDATLLIAGAEDPFWATPGINPPPDTTAPTVKLTKPNQPATVASSVAIAWTGSDAGSGVNFYEVRFRAALYSGHFGSWSAPVKLNGHSATLTDAKPGHDYCIDVRATDNAGNTSTWSAARCTAVPLDDRSLATSSGWNKGTGSAYYEHTITTSTKQGATLARTHAEVDRIGVLATTCAKCGSVAVSIGSHHVGTISLHAASTHHRVLKLLPTFSTRSGTVKLKVTTSGKPVAIDGLLLSRT